MTDESQPEVEHREREHRSNYVGYAHVLQVLQIVFILGVGVAFAITRSQLDQLRADWESAHNTMDVRMSIAEKSIVARQNDEHDFAVEMRQALGKVNENLTDLRVQMTQVLRRR